MTTKNLAYAPRFHFCLSMAVLIAALAGGVACSRGNLTPVVIAPSPEISQPTVTLPIAMKPGQQTSISIEVISSTSTAMTYTWTIEAGEIVNGQGSPAIIYRAPDKPGTYDVRVTVNWDDQSVKKVTVITVEEDQTPTPTPTVSPTPTVTSTPTPTPTDGTAVKITITEPEREVECPQRAPCTFIIKGVSTGIASNSTHKIVPFVNPSPGDTKSWFPQPDRPLGSNINENGTWQAQAQIGTEEGEEPGHNFEVVALVMDATDQITKEFQLLPPSIVQSNIVSLVTAGKEECPLVPSSRIPIEGPPVDVEVDITSPKHCETGLYTTVPVGGTYSGDLTGKEIWILIYPTDRKYYPQTTDACAQIPSEASGGKWETIVNLGGPPQQYDVIAVVTDTDAEASLEFKKWLKNGCDTNIYPGYLKSRLPSGITEVAAITVSTE